MSPFHDTIIERSRGSRAPRSAARANPFGSGRVIARGVGLLAGTTTVGCGVSLRSAAITDTAMTATPNATINQRRRRGILQYVIPSAARDLLQSTDSRSLATLG